MFVRAWVRPPQSALFIQLFSHFFGPFFDLFFFGPFFVPFAPFGPFFCPFLPLKASFALFLMRFYFLVGRLCKKNVGTLAKGGLNKTGVETPACLDPPTGSTAGVRTRDRPIKRDRL
jgi:hypothetical protein